MPPAHTASPLPPCTQALRAPVPSAITEDECSRLDDEHRGLLEQLGSEVYQKTQLLPLDFFQKNCKVLVKMSLEHEGISAEK